MIEQLIKKNPTGEYDNVMPKSWIGAITDKSTGQSLVEILQGFNMYFLSYNGNTASTRCLVPDILRKKGLWITYVKYDGNVYVEYYVADKLDDKSWGDSSNWRIGNNTLVGDITISANGNWVVNGTELEAKAIGEKGNTPILRIYDNKLQVSYNLGETYIDVTDNPVYTNFRWTDEGTQDNNMGRIQASTDGGKTWVNMSNDFTSSLHISKYVGADEHLPIWNIAEGTIYAKGPTYAADDTSHSKPIYRLWVYAWKNNVLDWQDHGEFTSIQAGIVQETGNSENVVMSQKAVTDKFNNLCLQELGDSTQFPVSQKIITDNLNSVKLSDFYYPFNINGINLLKEHINENFKGIVISCEEGDTFKIKGSGGSAIYLYTFIDKDWKPIDGNNSGASATINTLTTITAGQGAKWLVANFNITEPYSLIDCRSIKDISVNNDLKSLKEQINIIKNGGTLNLNLLNNKEGDAGVNNYYETSLVARESIPFYFRFKGLCVLYKLENIGWITEQYIGNYPNSTTWADNNYWVKRNIKEYTVIAASDSINKANADLVCSGQMDNVIINLALDNNNVLLLSGTFNITNPITLSRSNCILKGLNSVIVNNGSTNNAIITSSNSQNTIVENINCGNSVINLYSSGSGRIVNCFHRGILENDSNITVKAVQGLSGINNAISKFDETGGIIFLEEGIYKGSDAVNLTKSNIIIVGKGRNTILSRSTGYNEIICNTTGVKNCIIKDLYITNSVHHNDSNRTLIEDFRLENCWINTIFTNETEPTILTVGLNSNFNTLSSAINYVTHAQLKNKDQHYEIHIYGDIKETNSLAIDVSNVDIIGHNTKITLHGDGNVCAKFYGHDYKVSNIHFYKTGCYNGYQDAAAIVFSDSVTFENCTFENTSFSTKPFNQEDYVISAEETKGCRRHGILVYCNKYGAECKTIFKNCIAIGSPFSYQNTRGWYLVTGAPKLYNCIGYGGGIGEFGHGIQNHRTSKAELHSCVGYAGKNSYRQASGIRMQAMGSPNMIGCIGYGSCGVKMKYLGFSQEEIEVAGGSMNLTVEQAKTKLVELNANIEESYGISMWANNGIQQLISCEGFAGSGINSSGLHIISDASPKIIGGIFGKEDISTLNPFIKDVGYNYMTFTPSEDKINKFTSYEIETVNVTIVKSAETNKVGYKFYLETVEDVPQIIVDGQNMYGVTSILNCTINKTIVPANTPLRAYVKDSNGNMVNLPDDENPDKCTLWVCMIIKYADSSIKGIHIANTASPQILSSKLNGTLRIETDSTDYIVKDCIIEGDISSNKNNLRVYDCIINGNINSSLTFSTKNYVNDSSNFKV